MTDKFKKLKTLFLSNLYISAFTFGGGMVIVTFMKKKFVDELHFIDEDEMLDIVAISQCSPGVIAVNASIMVGLKIAGLLGMIISVIGTILPPMTILLIISKSYEAFIQNPYIAIMLKGMQAGVTAVLMEVTIQLTLNLFHLKNHFHYAVLVACFIAKFFFDVNVIFLIIGGILAGILSELIKMKGQDKIS